MYQGIANFSAVTVGTFVDMDGAVQSDGSLLATRIAAQDTNIQNLSVLTGPVMQTNTAAPILFALGRAQQGYFSANNMAAVWMPYSDPSATFQVSGQLGNLQSLPFLPTFNGTNVVDGQEVYVTTQVTSFSGGYPYIPATTVTLMPQTINGTVVASSTFGNFTDYTVSLSSYDLFPTLAVQQGQTTLLTNPGEVEVYVDSNTQMLNTVALAPGSRHRGPRAAVEAVRQHRLIAGESHWRIQVACLYQQNVARLDDVSRQHGPVQFPRECQGSARGLPNVLGGSEQGMSRRK